MNINYAREILKDEINASGGLGDYKMFTTVLRMFKFNYPKTRQFLLEEGYPKTTISNQKSKFSYAQKLKQKNPIYLSR